MVMRQRRTAVAPDGTEFHRNTRSPFTHAVVGQRPDGVWILVSMNLDREKALRTASATVFERCDPRYSGLQLTSLAVVPLTVTELPPRKRVWTPEQLLRAWRRKARRVAQAQLARAKTPAEVERAQARLAYLESPDSRPAEIAPRARRSDWLDQERYRARKRIARIEAALAQAKARLAYLESPDAQPDPGRRRS